MERAELLSSIAAMQRQLQIAMTMLAVSFAETPELPPHENQVEMERSLAMLDTEQAVSGHPSGVARVRAASETETEDEEDFEFPDQVDSNQHDLLSSVEQPIDMNDPNSVYKVLQDNVNTCVALGAQLVYPKTQRKRAMMKQLMTLLIRTLNFLRSVNANMRDDVVSSTLLSDLRASLLNAVSNLDAVNTVSAIGARKRLMPQCVEYPNAKDRSRSGPK